MNIYILILILSTISIIYYWFLKIEKFDSNFKIENIFSLNRAYLYLFTFLISGIMFSILFFLKTEFSINSLNFFKILNYNIPFITVLVILIFIAYIKEFIYIFLSNKLIIYKLTFITISTFTNILITVFFIKNISLTYNVIIILSNINFTQSLLKQKEKINNKVFTCTFIFNIINLFINSFLLFYTLTVI